jgi:hypothetical protein
VDPETPDLGALDVGEHDDVVEIVADGVVERPATRDESQRGVAP